MKLFQSIISGLLLFILVSCSGDDSGGGGGGGGGGGDNTPKPPKDVTGPLLSVTSPTDRSTLSGLSSLTLEGECEAGGTDVTVSGDIDGDETSTPCGEDGMFSTDVDIVDREEGRGLILEQSDDAGNTSTISVHLGKFVFVLRDIKQIASGTTHTCALNNDGEVKCWGGNANGQLGNKSTTDSFAPVAVHTSSSNTDILDDITQIAAKGYHTCALTDAGKVKCWGNGADGRLGNGETTDSTTPVDVCARAKEGTETSCPLLDSISQIALGSSHTCAVTTGNRAKCWGDGAFGKLGYGGQSSSSYPKEVKRTSSSAETNVVSVSLGANHSCAVLDDGEVRCWGRGDYGQLGTESAIHSSTNQSYAKVVRVGGLESDPLSEISAISLGDDYSCALTTSGTVKCWGSGQDGRLGNNGLDNVPAPVDVCARPKKTGEETCPPLSGVEKLSAGSSHSCAIMSSGKLKCWGGGSNGQLGNGEVSDGLYPVDVCAREELIGESSCPLLNNIAEISMGKFHSCLLTNDGKIKCWGEGAYGKLGNWETTNSSYPVDALSDKSDWKAFHDADSAENFDSNLLLNPDDDSQYIASGRCFDDGSDVAISGDVESDSQIFCSDYGTYYLHFTFDDTETETKSITFTQYDSFNNKISLDASLSKNLRDISQISTRFNHTCALTKGGNVKCWGWGGKGRLGHGVIQGSNTPVYVHTSETDSDPLSEIAAISSGESHTCALTDSGTVKCWGNGADGRLGNGATSESYTPIDVHTSDSDTSPLSDITAISSGYYHVCALTDSGTVKCWGTGNDGRLGDGGTSDRTTPVDVCEREKTADEASCPKLSGIVAIAAGEVTSCALTDTGNVKCWGKGDYGQIGNGETESTNAYPVDVHTGTSDSTPLGDITAIDAGDHHFCALTRSGNMKCWGGGGNRELGHGEASNGTTPVDVCEREKAADEAICPPLSDIVSIGLGGNHSCALTNNGNVKCWGGGSDGKLGNGQDSSSFYPVDVHTSSLDSNSLSGIATINPGGSHTCALTTNGQVKCWGKGDSGRLGTGITDSSTTPVDVTLGYWNPLEITPPSYGEDFYVDTQFTSHTFSLQGKCSIHGSTIEISGDVEGTPTTTCSDYGRFNLEITLSSASNDKTLTITQTLEGKSETNTLTLQADGEYDSIALINNIAMVAAGQAHTCALTHSGAVKCWGTGDYGILGNGKTSNSLVPVDVHSSSTDSSPLSGITQIAAGFNHTCALTTDGEVKCWGLGTNGQLGNGANSISKTPVSVCASAKTGSPPTCPALTNIAAITTWLNTTCALTDSNTVKCWGAGNNGYLGNGADSDSNIPVDVHTDSGDTNALSGIEAISGTCALTDSGNVKCWGYGDSGALGNGGTSHSNTPVTVCERAKTDVETTCPALANIVAISAEMNSGHRCALNDSGALKCWGSGNEGQLGNGATTSTNSYPVDVRTSSSNSDAIEGIEKVSVGHEYTCAVTDSGTVKCWGGGDNGRLGNGGTSRKTSPVDVVIDSGGDLLNDIASMGAGNQHICAVTLDGTVKCWGKGNNGRLGHGATDDSSYPVDVIGGRKWTVVAP